MEITILTLFPEYFDSILASSMLHRAQVKQLVTFNIINIRDFANDKHHTTDERPYGGGAGMVMKVEPIDLALKSLGVSKGQAGTLIVLTSAKGKIFAQPTAQDWSKLEKLVIICGHYEGVDERVAEYLVDAEIRIGDYVMTGGEPAAAVMADAVTRLLPGVLGNEESIQGESHSEPGLLTHPQYTRPEEYQGWRVPEVLLEGHHAKIEKWRKKQQRTIKKSS